jgi:hypothetical protein
MESLEITNNENNRNMKTTETILVPPVRKAGPKKECDQVEIAATATKFFLALLEKYPPNTRKMHARSIFDLQNTQSNPDGKCIERTYISIVPFAGLVTRLVEVENNGQTSKEEE